MKKYFSITISFIIILLSCIITNAAENSKITIGSVKVERNDTFEIPIIVENNPGIIATRLYVSYDSSKIKLIEAKNGSIFDNSTSYFSNNTDEIPYTLLWEDALASNNNYKNGTLAILSFKKLSTFNEGTSTIVLAIDDKSTFDVNLNNVKFASNNGTVSVIGNTQKNQSTTTSKVSSVQTTKAISSTNVVLSEQGNTTATIQKCAHKTKKWIKISDSTCNKEGKEKLVCQDCKIVLAVQSIPISAHNFSSWKQISNSNEKKAYARTCLICGFEENKEEQNGSTIIHTIPSSTSKQEKELNESGINTSLYESTTQPEKQGEQSKNNNTAKEFIIIGSAVICLLSLLLILYKKKGKNNV